MLTYWHGMSVGNSCKHPVTGIIITLLIVMALSLPFFPLSFLLTEGGAWLRITHYQEWLTLSPIAVGSGILYTTALMLRSHTKSTRTIIPTSCHVSQAEDLPLPQLMVSSFRQHVTILPTPEWWRLCKYINASFIDVSTCISSSL